ncbi:MAG: YicC/YloC family endoribonuclease [Candidatus Rokuibacteriota bacterium]
MTGFARAEASDTKAVVVVEARSVNHRHLDIGIRLPRALAAFEMDARRLVQSRLERGRVDIAVQLSPIVGASLQQVGVDHALARVWLGEARGLGKELGLQGEVSLAWILERPGVARLEEAEAADPSLAWPTLAQVLNAALDGLIARRATEGEALDAELRALHAELGATVGQIAERVPAALARRTERLRERIRALLADATLDEGRVATEVAVWAERTDITEELVRLRAHLEQFALTLDKGGPVGRLFDFLIQELNRELNTVGAKADDLELSQAVIAAKGVLEKMREQAQNLE